MPSRTDAAPRWLDVREQTAWRAFLDMQDKLNAAINRDLQDSSGLSTADFAVLVRLSEHADQRMRVLELARAVRWEKSRLSHQLSRMAARGLVERSHCSEDRHGAWIVLTAAGRAAVEQAAPHHVATVRRYLFDRLSADQVDALAAISQAVVDGLEPECARICAAEEAASPEKDLRPG